jgi:rod shape determining protein RodA
LALALVLCKCLSQSKLKLTDLILPFIICFLPFIFTVTQPDLGTSLVMFIIGGTMVLFIGVEKKILFTIAAVGLISAPLAWNYGLKTYQKQRILTFLNPGSDIRGGGYNSHQSKIAVGSGLLLGRGYLKGTQSQLQFLPERHTDFIFSVLSEEHGFTGSFLVLFLFFLLFLNIINTAQESPDSFGTLVCIGTGAIIFWHVFINIAMITGLMPIVGVPLPLFSYGGSSILTTMASLGLVSNVSKRRYLF